MADLESVISASIASAREAGVEPATPDDPGMEPQADVVDDAPPADADAVADVSDDVEPDAEPDAAKEPAAKAAAKEPAKEPAKPAGKVDAVKAAADAAAAAKKAGEEDDLDKIPERDAQGRINRVPHTRVKAIVATGVKKAEAQWAETRLKPVEQKAQAYEERLTRVGQVEDVMFNKPEQFVGILRTIPGYNELFQLMGLQAKEPAKAAAADTSGDFAEEMPAPDGEGGAGYTPEGLAKLLDWTSRKATHAAVKLTEERLGARIKPFEERDKAYKSRIDKENEIAADLDRASKWEGFVENAQDILAVLKADTAGALSLDDAYRQVLARKYKEATDANAVKEADVRAQVLKELQSAPRSTSAGSPAARSTSAVAAAKKEGPRDLEDVIRESLAPLRRRGQ